MPYTIPSTEYLEINSVPLSTTGWRTIDIAPLFDSAPQRGENVIIPNSSGRKAYKPYADEWPIQLFLRIVGAKDWNDTPAVNKRSQLLANIEHLKTNVVNPTGTGDGTRTAVWHRADGTTKTGPVQVRRLTCADVTPGAAAVRAVLELLVPAGQFS